MATLQQFQSVVKKRLGAGSTLTLDTALLPQTNFGALLGNAIQQKTLTLSQLNKATLKYTDSYCYFKSAVTIKTLFLEQVSGVEAWLFVDPAGHAQAIVSIPIPKGRLTFGNTRFTQGKYVLSTYEGTPKGLKKVERGLFVECSLSLTTGWLFELLGHSRTLQFSGPKTGDYYYDLYKMSAKIPTISVPLVTVGGTPPSLSNITIACSAVKIPSDATALPRARVELTADVQVADYTLQIKSNAVSLDRSVSDIELWVRSQKKPLPSLTKLAGWMGAGGLARFLPKPLKTFGSLTITGFGITFSPNDKRINNVSLTVATTEPWSIVTRFFELEKGLSLTWFVSNPFPESGQKRQVAVSVDAVMNFKNGAARFAVAASSPNFQLGGLLKDGGSFKLSTIVSAFGLKLPAGMPELTCGTLAFEIDARNGNYYLDIGFTGTWPLIGPFTMKDVGLTIHYMKGQGGRSAQKYGKAYGVLNIAGCDIMLSASYTSDGATTAWLFEGATGDGQHLPIGQLLAALTKTLSVDDKLPEALVGTSIDNLGFVFDTSANKKLMIGGALKTETGDTNLQLLVAIEMTNTGGKYTKDFQGIALVDDLELNIRFNNKTLVEPNAKVSDSTLIATLGAKPAKEPTLNDLIASLSPSLAEFIPDALKVSFKNLVLVQRKANQKTAWLLAADLGFSTNFGNLPLVGSAVSGGQAGGLQGLQFILATQAFTLHDISIVNDLLPTTVSALPIGSNGAQSGETQGPAITKGLTLAATLQLGDAAKLISLPISRSQKQTPAKKKAIPGHAGAVVRQPVEPAPVPQDGSMAQTDGAKWFAVQKSLGPLYFERIGVQYKDKALWFLLDASLGAAGLTLSLDGLGFGSPIDHFEPEFTLNGLGIDYRRGPIEIGGAFMKIGETNGNAEYGGAVILKATKFTLSAMGAYTTIDGDPSLFVYGVLDYPLGGPPIFFVNGLAAGFGYNRRLEMPEIDDVDEFPLIQAATSPAQNKIPASSDAAQGPLMQQLQSMRKYIPPTSGAVFLAVGVKFLSFKLIESFLLIAVQFGKRDFEIDVLGISTLVVPPNLKGDAKPLAQVRLLVKGQFIPAQGILSIEARLDSEFSYVLSEDCRLQGGFAFYNWFGNNPHAGDFVLTLGGYHPHFTPPAYYPQDVPRLGFNWQISDELYVKGDGYFALTAKAFMAGGHLEAAYKSSAIEASFKVGADFLIIWKPFHYEASIYIDIHGKAGPISVDLGADLELQGPEFSGVAKIHFLFLSVEITFGDPNPALKPISWDDFREAFLPDSTAVCSLAVDSGLMHKDEEKALDLGAINPKELVISANSMIPVNAAKIHTSTKDYSLDLTLLVTNVGETKGEPFVKTGSAFKQARTSPFLQAEDYKPSIAPMALTASEITSTMTLTIQLKDGTDKSDHFAFSPILKKMPAAMWGKPNIEYVGGETMLGQPDLSAEDQFLEHAVTGFELTPNGPATPGSSKAVDRQELSYADEFEGSAFQWQTLKTFQTNAALKGAAARSNIGTNVLTAAKATANPILAAWGYKSTDVDVSATGASAIQETFIRAPKIETV